MNNADEGNLSSSIIIEFIAPQPKKRAAPVQESEGSKVAAQNQQSPEKVKKMETIMESSPALQSNAQSAVQSAGCAKKMEELYGLTEEEAKQPYNPLKPNEYENIIKERRKKKFEDEIRRKKAQELRDLEKDRSAPQSMDLNITGEQAYMERMRKSAASGTAEERVLGMMKKMGWTGKGLGKDEQGITAPLVVKKTDRMSGVIVSGTKSEIVPKGTVLNAQPTRVVQFKNIDPEDADEGLQKDMIDGCKPYGTVLVLLTHKSNYRATKFARKKKARRLTKQ